MAATKSRFGQRINNNCRSVSNYNLTFNTEKFIAYPERKQIAEFRIFKRIFKPSEANARTFVGMSKNRYIAVICRVKS